MPSAEDAPRVGVALLAEGVLNIELCGGFSAAAAAAVVDAVAGRAAVGHVTYAADSLHAAVRFADAAAADG